MAVTNVIKEIAKIHENNYLTGKPVREEESSLLFAAHTSGSLNWLGKLGRFLEKHLKFLGIKSLADRENEIRQASYEVFAKLPDYEQINPYTDKVLYEYKSEATDKGYIIKLEGFETVIYTTYKMKKKNETREEIDPESRESFINLSDKFQYDVFQKELKELLPDNRYWRDFLEPRAEGLKKTLSKFDFDKTYKFAKSQSEDFLRETNIDIDFSCSNNNLDECHKIQIVQFYLMHHEEFPNLLAKYNTSVLEGIYDYYDQLKDIDENRVIKENFKLLANAMSSIIKNPPSPYLSKQHKTTHKFLNDAFKKIKDEGLYNALSDAKENRMLLTDIVKSIRTTLPTGFYELRPGTQKILYTNHDDSYQIVQEGRRIFLYSGKPLSILNSQLKTEIVPLQLNTETNYTQLKNNLSTNSLWSSLKSRKFADKYLGEQLVSNLTVILEDFLSEQGEEFEQTTQKVAEALNIEHAKDLQSNRNLLAILYLLCNEDICTDLIAFGMLDTTIINEFKKLASQTSEVAKYHIQLLYEAIWNINQFPSDIQELKALDPIIFYPVTSTKLLALLDYEENLFSYGIQKAEEPELEKLSYVIRDNYSCFKQFEIVISDNPEDYISAERIKEMEIRLRERCEQFAKVGKPIDAETIAGIRNAQRENFNPKRLQEKTILTTDGSQITLAEHYISKLQLLYKLIGLIDDEIPIHPLTGDGALNPIVGRKIKQYLIANPHIVEKYFRLSGSNSIAA